MDNIFVRIIDMPLCIKGLTKLSKDNDYNVYINAKYSYEEQKKILSHEMCHIKGGHFYSDIPAYLCEMIADEA